MKIEIINGSPRGGKSNSEILIKYLCSLLEGHKINKYYSFSSKMNSEIKSEIHNADVLIFVFPLYVDSIPSHLLDTIVKFEEEKIINEILEKIEWGIFLDFVRDKSKKDLSMLIKYADFITNLPKEFITPVFLVFSFIFNLFSLLSPNNKVPLFSNL